MADNNVTAAGPTRGALYVLPWDTMAQYDQMVTATRDKFEAQNQQRLATIADMEKQDLTGMPSYDKALEDHYEKLHGDVGKIITKYRDPFQSLEGMRALKDVQAKYIANPIVNNAKTTEDSFKRLQSDYATNLITPEDYNIKKGEYDKHITEGDVSKPFEYGRPDYLQSSKIFDDVFKDMDKSVLSQSPNGSTVGYSDPQIDQAVNLAMIGQHGAALEREIDQNLTQQGISINEQSRQAEGVRLAKLYKPLDRNKVYHQQTADNGNVGGYMPSDILLNTGVIGSNFVSGFLNLDAKKNLILDHVGRGKDNEVYGFDTKGMDIKFKSSDPVILGQSNFANATIQVPRQKLANSFIDKVQTAAKNVGLDNIGLFRTVNTETALKDLSGNSFVGVNPIDQSKFEALVNDLKLPKGPDGTWDYIAQEYNSGKYQLPGKIITINDQTIVDKGLNTDPNKLTYSVNAVLFHLMNHGVTMSTQPATNESVINLSMAGFTNQKVDNDWVNVEGVQLPLRINNKNLMEYDVANNIVAGKTGSRNMQRMLTGTDNYSGVLNGMAIGKDAVNGWRGVVNVKAGIETQQVGKDNFSELLSVPEAFNVFKQKYNITKDTQPGGSYETESEKSMTPLERTTGANPQRLQELFTAGGENSFDNTSKIILNGGLWVKDDKNGLSYISKEKYDELNSDKKFLIDMKNDLLTRFGGSLPILSKIEVEKLIEGKKSIKK